jgi:hypothetical protein
MNRHERRKAASLSRTVEIRSIPVKELLRIPTVCAWADCSRSTPAGQDLLPGWSILLTLRATCRRPIFGMCARKTGCVMLRCVRNIPSSWSRCSRVSRPSRMHP